MDDAGSLLSSHLSAPLNCTPAPFMWIEYSAVGFNGANASNTELLASLIKAIWTE